MAKAGRGADQYMLRFPPGLRDRVKAYAELQGRSMNEEIIRILENEFPEPVGIESRVSYILDLLRILKAGAEKTPLSQLSGELLDTVRAIADGTIQGVDEDSRERIRLRLDRWEEEFADDEAELSTHGLDQVEIEALSTGRSTAKYPLDPEWRSMVRRLERGDAMSDEQFEVYREGYEAGLKARYERISAVDLDDEKDVEP
ncbi:Arc family DNA-binding protein [Aurantimonas aggregata]|uniref:Arc family DNA-binding protein n=1 Tax=Aurantimonas aggregata TaxID=2047720 RepID=A0A6L9MM45_9HYPH|nr:Arc family DNA-binding protein [Aurantimonas aggregata]NDV88772.1 Arc family DNA-binding protein [Aurantimonas aggregata]